MFDVVSIGTATTDVFLKTDKSSLKKSFFGTKKFQCFPLGEKIGSSDLVLSTGGGAANSAVSFTRQKLSTGVVFKVGDDIFGTQVIKSLQSEKISTFPSIAQKRKTDFSTILITPDGSRTILVHRDASSSLTSKDIPFSKLKTSWVYINPSNISFSVINSLVSKFKEQGTKIALNPSQSFIDIGAEKLHPLLNKINVIILNREEASSLTGISYSKEKEIFKKFDELVEGIAVMTEGPKGVMVSDGTRIFRAGIFKNQEIVDRTGAGDAFGSGFVSGLIRSKENCQQGICGTENIKQAIRLGSANATSVVEQFGAQAGLLTKTQLNSPRFKRLKISIERI